MSSSFVIAIVLAGLVIYLTKPNFVIPFWIIVEPVLYPLWAFLVKIKDYDSLLVSHGLNSVARRNMVIILILIAIFRERSKIPPKLIPIIWLVALLIWYLFIQNCFVNFYLGGLNSIFLSILGTCSLLALFLIDPKTIPSKKIFWACLFGLFGYEIVWLVLNYLHIYPFIPIMIGYKVSAAGYYYDIDTSLYAGSFLRFNKLSNFLTTIYLFLSLEHFDAKKCSRKCFLVLTVLCFVAIFLTGSKMSLLIMVMILFVSMSVKMSLKRIFQLILFGILMLCVYMFIFANSSYWNTGFAGLDRIVNGLVAAKSGTSSSTLSLSTHLLQNYFDNPLLGVGLSGYGERAYGGQYTLIHYQSDARLAYLIVEYGLIGFLLIAVVFFKTSFCVYEKINKSAKKKLIACFSYYVVLTITELGFFDQYVYPFLFIYIFSVLIDSDRNHVESQISKGRACLGMGLTKTC